MIDNIDLNSIDAIGNLIHIPSNFINPETLEMDDNTIIQQYVQFQNLGANLLDTIENTYKHIILSNMLEYVNENYLSIVDLDTTLLFPEKTLEVGKLIYSFVCIDCYNTLIPNFLNSINCNSIETFDSVIQSRFKNNYNLVKINIIKLINAITEELLKLQRIDSSVQKDEQYQRLLYKFSYYTELIDFADSEKFINNFIRPVLIKNLDSILWRII
jgi:hypothetical protein